MYLNTHNSENYCFFSEKCQYESVNVRDIISRYIVDVTSCCFFGLISNALTESESDLLKLSEKFTQSSVVNVWLLFLKGRYPGLLYWLKTKLSRFQNQRAIVDIIKMNDELRKSGSIRFKSFMQSLLDLRDLSQQKVLSEKNSNKNGLFCFLKYFCGHWWYPFKKEINEKKFTNFNQATCKDRRTLKMNII